MNTSKEYYQPVLEALSAFVRGETKNKTDDEPPSNDVQAALTVIGRRVSQAKCNPHPIYHSVANLSGAILSGANLLNANLRRANNLTQQQLDQACGTGVKLDPPLTIKPCSPK